VSYRFDAVWKIGEPNPSATTNEVLAGGSQ
jgi:hypothetical protein